MGNDEPIFYDAKFRQKRKGGKWREVEAPALEGPVADTHAHLQMLADPALELARAAAHNVRFVETIVDPADDGFATFDALPGWLMEASRVLRAITAASEGADGPAEAAGAGAAREPWAALPAVRIAAGVHPHNAKGYTPAVARALREHLHDRRVSAVGEIGLDYHYDLSPREVQREVFRAQIRLAKEAGLPVCLHLREAHDDGFAILSEEGFPEAGTLLHCFNLDAAEVARWVEAGCFIAFGGPVTFKRADEVREAAAIVPADRLLTETDSPYMTPEPLRGTHCGPAHTVFTAAKLCEVRGADTPKARAALLAQLYANALALLDRAPTAWQREEAARGGEEVSHA
ncbi:TatD family hydrolase [uncultured Adlercreutzia sp.]|uniref:TatD family hydrolase n=1 Tax=uncultured Adlercreutzia sp. TaxID=875803 RepID=UPI00267609C2|nr:TatD family hydrolase [uncultured Adlercreutzia sp.]